MICGEPLKYLEQSEPLVCVYCGRQEHGHIKCPQGHYTCDACHGKDSLRAIKEATLTADSKDPIEIAEQMMEHPGLPMLGCQHAYIAAGALLAAIRNEGSRTISEGDVSEVFERIDRQAIGGYCGLTGVCGIMLAIGACFAMLLGSKCGKDTEQKITMDATVAVAKAIADLTGPSCCKAYVRAALLVAVEFLKERLEISLPVTNPSVFCSYVSKHPHGCRSDRCPYFIAGDSSIGIHEDVRLDSMDAHDISSDC